MNFDCCPDDLRSEIPIPHLPPEQQLLTAKPATGIAKTAKKMGWMNI